MKFPSPLIEGRLIRRYKRFLADVELTTGQVITAHTANTGAMAGCAEPGSRVWLSISDNPKRKYPHSWELVEVSDNPPTLLGINTQLANALVEEAIVNGTITELQGYQIIRREVRYGDENSRIDLLLEDPNKKSLQNNRQALQCYVEVKNATLVKDNTAYFPDAVTIRGTKHLRELVAMVKQGNRAVIFYCVQRQGVNQVRVAQYIDPDYAEALQQVIAAGVEALAYVAEVTPREISLKQSVPVLA